MIKPVFTSMARGHPSNSCAANARRHKQIICHIKNASLRRISGRLPFTNCQVKYHGYALPATLHSTEPDRWRLGND